MPSRLTGWHFSIDRYLNPWIPKPPWAWLPAPVSHFLGHRAEPAHAVGNVVMVFWAFIGVFCGLTVIEAVSRQVPSFQHHGAPLIIGSFGAASVLEFYAIESPLAQPRSAVLSQVLASVVGVAIRSLLDLSAASRDLMWLGGSLSCACTTAAMALTGTVHPPAGATALLAVVDENVALLGWYLLPVMLLGCVLMQCVALVVNNMQRRFPVYWWTPEEVGKRWGHGERQATAEEGANASDGNSYTGQKLQQPRSSHLEEGRDSIASDCWLVISKDQVAIPQGLDLAPEELSLLQALRGRLQQKDE